MTDNAMTFTMRYTAHPERRTAFQQMADVLGMRHGTIQSRSPWQNGFIERSHRTENDECFQGLRFASSEDRRYQHRLWEMGYNNTRPHQGIGNRTPLQVWQRDYRIHAVTRMLMASQNSP